MGKMRNQSLADFQSVDLVQFEDEGIGDMAVPLRFGSHRTTGPDCSGRRMFQNARELCVRFPWLERIEPVLVAFARSALRSSPGIRFVVGPALGIDHGHMAALSEMLRRTFGRVHPDVGKNSAAHERFTCVSRYEKFRPCSKGSLLKSTPGMMLFVQKATSYKRNFPRSDPAPACPNVRDRSHPNRSPPESYKYLRNRRKRGDLTDDGVPGAALLGEHLASVESFVPSESNDDERLHAVLNPQKLCRAEWDRSRLRLDGDGDELGRHTREIRNSRSSGSTRVLNPTATPKRCPRSVVIAARSLLKKAK